MEGRGEPSRYVGTLPRRIVTDGGASVERDGAEEGDKHVSGEEGVVGREEMAWKALAWKRSASGEGAGAMRECDEREAVRGREGSRRSKKGWKGWVERRG